MTFWRCTIFRLAKPAFFRYNGKFTDINTYICCNAFPGRESRHCLLSCAKASTAKRDGRLWRRVYKTFNMAGARSLKDLLNRNLLHFTRKIQRFGTTTSSSALQRFCRCASTFSFVPDSPSPLEGKPPKLNYTPTGVYSGYSKMI